jgi:nucleotide-binding universal stress UspA family protein
MYSRILIATDGSTVASRGLREAVALARALKAQLVVLHVIDDFPVTGTSIDTRHEILDKAAELALESGVACKTVLHEQDTNRTADAIVDRAAREHCNLIVMGTHGRRGVSRVLLGSDCERVLRLSPIPVMVVREPE